ncbi:MAG TPA: hypothetical protein VGF39_08720 [Stellaceae bacterium]
MPKFIAPDLGGRTHNHCNWAIHGLSRAEIIANGRSVREVAAELTAHTQGAKVLSDAPTYDTKWLRDLYL